MLPIIALAVASLALLLAVGALAMSMKQRKNFQSLLSTVRTLEENAVEGPATPSIGVADSSRQPPAAAGYPAAASPPLRAEPSPDPSPPAPLPEGEGSEGNESTASDTDTEQQPQSGADEPATTPTAPAPQTPFAGSPEPEPSPKKPEPPPANPKWQAWLDQLRTLPHGAVAALLGEVLQHSKHLARGFASDEQQQAFTHEVGDGFHRRLTRFQECARDEATFVERWVEPDLITALDLLARFQSQAAADARDGHAPAAQLATWLGTALYDQLGPACQGEGWFALERIEPFRTSFDPQLHKGIDGRQVPGARGLVVEVERVGRSHPVDAYPIDKAHVVVGR